MKCANCGNTDPKHLFDEGDDVFCNICYHHTRKSDGKDNLIVCPVCHHLRDRKSFNCMWCNSPQGDNTYDPELDAMATEFENTVKPSNLRYYKLIGRRHV